MIDARDQIVSSPVASNRQRKTTLSSARSVKDGGSLGKRTLPMGRVFSDSRIKPFDQIEWDRRTAEITDDSGKVIFKQETVEVPKSWSVLATKVVVSKYF